MPYLFVSEGALLGLTKRTTSLTSDFKALEKSFLNCSLSMDLPSLFGLNSTTLSPSVLNTSPLGSTSTSSERSPESLFNAVLSVPTTTFPSSFLYESMLKISCLENVQTLSSRSEEHTSELQS